MLFWFLLGGGFVNSSSAGDDLCTVQVTGWGPESRNITALVVSVEGRGKALGPSTNGQLEKYPLGSTVNSTAIGENSDLSRVNFFSFQRALATKVNFFSFQRALATKLIFSYQRHDEGLDISKSIKETGDDAVMAGDVEHTWSNEKAGWWVKFQLHCGVKAVKECAPGTPKKVEASDIVSRHRLSYRRNDDPVYLRVLKTEASGVACFFTLGVPWYTDDMTKAVLEGMPDILKQTVRHGEYASRQSTRQSMLEDKVTWWSDRSPVPEEEDYGVKKLGENDAEAINTVLKAIAKKVRKVVNAEAKKTKGATDEKTKEENAKKTKDKTKEATDKWWRDLFAFKWETSARPISNRGKPKAM